MCISHDDQFLISVGEDGTIFTFRIIDKEGRMMKRERESNYAEEILITRSDLEEKVRGGMEERDRLLIHSYYCLLIHLITFIFYIIIIPEYNNVRITYSC